MSRTPSSPVDQRRYHELIDPHHRTPWLADVVLGGQDGLVNVLGVILGLAAATENAQIVLIAGLASAIAGSVSMAAVAYTSRVAAADLFKSERAREYRHVTAVPELERAEVRDIYAKKGFSGDLLERTVQTITNNPDVWVAVMMAEEHGLVDTDRRRSVKSAATVGTASLVGSLLPLAPFLVLPVGASSWGSVIVATVALFAFGAYKGRVTVGHPLKGGLELAAIGILSALAGYGVGKLLHVPA